MAVEVVDKYCEDERPVPECWRNTLREVVKEIAAGRRPCMPEVFLASPKAWADMVANIHAYGAHLIDLPEETWSTSVCIWNGTCWEVLLDLFTFEEGRSDLVLEVLVHEASDGYRFELLLIYVP